jgi:hypothetical protein
MANSYWLEQEKKYLKAIEDAGRSGISMDIYTKASNSHRKNACSPKAQVPFINNVPIKSKEQLLKLNLTEEEKSFNNNSEQSTFHFRNGINLKPRNIRIYCLEFIS